jgi:hypothetical protein
MRIALIGCEYAGTTTLGNAIFDWSIKALGRKMMLHDHWKMPHISGHPPHETNLTLLTEEEKGQVQQAGPAVAELLMRYALYYHTPSSLTEDPAVVVGYHIEDLVYGPMYYGYGGDGEPGDRRVVAAHIEKRLAANVPQAALVLLEASPDVIRARMKANPHTPGVVPEKDIELVSRRFREEYERSLIPGKFTLDTTSATVEETMAEFKERIQPYLTHQDRMGLLANSADLGG